MNRRRFLRSPPLLAGLSAIVMMFVCLIAVGVVFHFQAPSHIGFVDGLVERGFDLFLVLWCLWVGVSIGSFLNVVAWRLPQGLGINGRSMCPRCRVQLKARDNFPVLGWIALGGRCRTCRLPISVRYPIVELVVGLSITLIVAGELGHLILPFPDAPLRPRPITAFRIDPQSVITASYHTIALSLCWTVGLIRVDGYRLPQRLISFSAIALIVPMLVYPTLMVVPWQMEVGESWQPHGRHLDAIVRVITALAAAIFLAQSMSRALCPTADPKLDPLGAGTNRLVDLIAILGIPILIVGWQASVAVVCGASLLAIAIRLFRPDIDNLGRLAISMPIAMTGQILVWQRSHHWELWPSEGSRPLVFLVWALLAMVIPLWLRDRGVTAAPRSDPASPQGSASLQGPNSQPKSGQTDCIEHPESPR